MLKSIILLVALASLLVSCAPVAVPSTPSIPTNSVTPVPTPVVPPTPLRGYCGDGRCAGPERAESCPADCPEAESSPERSAPVAGGDAAVGAEPPVLHLGIMVHLEGWEDDTNEARFRKHVELMREYADLFEAHGAKLTWESKEVTEGSLRWGDNVLLEMEQRGHGIGVHADLGGQTDYDCGRFAADLRVEREQLESLDVTVRHVSGIVSHCDWVTAAAEAGYAFATGQVAYAVMSLPPEDRPPAYRNCVTPARCHDTFPTDLADRVHPWRVNSGRDWLTPDPDGRLVLLPSSQGLPCMFEELTGAETKDCGRTFTQADLDHFFEQLEQAITLAEPGQVNIFYVSWSLGSQLDRDLLEAWLTGTEPYVDSGQVQWSTLPEMYDAYVRWEH